MLDSVRAMSWLINSQTISAKVKLFNIFRGLSVDLYELKE